MIWVLTNFAMNAGPAGWTFANVSTLGQYVASGTVLAGLVDTRIQGFLAIPAGELRRANALVIRWLVLFDRVIATLETPLVIKIVVVIALCTNATFLRILLRSWLIDRGAMRALTPDDAYAVLASVLIDPILTPLLQSSTFPTIAEILLVDRLTSRSVFTGKIGARVVSAFLNAISLQNVFISSNVQVHEYSIDLQLPYASQKTVVGADIVVDSVQDLHKYQ